MKKLATAPCSHRPIPRKKCIIPQVKKEKLNPVFLKKISISISENTPIKDVLTTIASNHGISIQIDKNIEDGIVYTTKNRPFIEVVKDLCEMIDLRYTTRGTFIKIEKDLPYAHNYIVNFLKFERESQNCVSSATDVFADKYSDNKLLQKSNGSNSEVKVTSSINFWDELEKGLAMILADAKYTIHRQGGLVSVIGTSKQHKLVSNYLKILDKVTNAQVLIEAKVIEVKLNQEFKTGIDWSWINRQANANHEVGTNFLNLIDDGADTFKSLVNLRDTHFSFILKALEKFGSLKIVSSPRITVLNNQTAVIKVAENQIFFKVDYQTHFLGVVDTPKNQNEDHDRFKVYSTSEIRTKPIGFIMPIQVCIKPETDEVILFVRPTVSRKARDVTDPAVDFNAKAAKIGAQDVPQSKIPVVEVREIDSVLRLKSGNIGILGGLMEIKSSDQSAHLPTPTKLDCAKTIVGSQSLKDEVSELVILFKATITDDTEDTISAADERICNEYVKDPRPF